MLRTGIPIGSKVADPVMMKRGFFDAKPKPKLRPRFDPAAENSTVRNEEIILTLIC